MSKVIELPVHSIAHSRAGDKGNVSNVSLITYNKNGWENIKVNATESKVLEIFKHLGATNVTRYELPNLMALNFLVRRPYQAYLPHHLLLLEVYLTILL